MPKVTQEKKSYNAAWKQANKAKIAAQKAAYYEANKAKIAAQKAAYYEANKAKIAAYRQSNKAKIAARQAAYYEANKAEKAAYYEANKAKIAARQAAYYEANNAKIAAYYEANKAKIAAQKAAYYEANNAKIAAQQSAYRQANKAKIAAWKAAWRHRYECELCCKKCGRLRPCTDPATNIDSMACRDCFMKVTGKDIRIEHEWSLYLDEHFFPEWRVCTDSRVGGESCSRYRPDGLWASPKIVLQWELDEKQHRGTSYDCDERRISELYDEFPGKQYVVVRVNPHGYKAPPGTKKPSQEERKALMLRVMHACLEKEWETHIHVVYMFYSADNANITHNLGKTLLFDAKDVDAFCVH